MALLVALMLVTLGPILETTAVPDRPSAWQVPNECLTLLFLAVFMLVFSLFPTGQFVPSFTRWMLVVFLVGQIPLLPNTSVSQLGWLVSLGEMATLALVQLYRYWRVSSPRERQQTKWVVFGLTVPITVAVSVSLPYLIFPVVNEPGSLYPLAYNQVSILLGFCIPLSLEEEQVILHRFKHDEPLETLQPIVSAEEVLALQDAIRQVAWQPEMERYLLAIVRATREHPAVTLGVSPRGTLALYRSCEAFAAMQGRDYVQPDDVKRLAPSVVTHRLLTTTRARLRGSAAEAIITEIVASVPVPVETISLPQKR